MRSKGGMLALRLPQQFHREMPVDTLYRLGTSPPSLGYWLGTSPPSLGFLYSFPGFSIPHHRATGMQKGASNGFNANIRTLDERRNPSPLRPCLRLLDKRKEDRCLGRSDGIVSTVRQRTSPDDDGMATTSPPAVTANSRRNEQNKKKVCFADSKGFDLQTVRIMDGPSDSPPHLSVNLIEDVIQDERAEPNHPFTYVTDFDQPASNYLDFRDRLERDNVCLENVLIKDNITVVGTAKVKNISFEKSVRARVTFDNWRSFRDIPGTYVSQVADGEEMGACAPAKYDTFSFEFDMPTNLAGRPFYFCICYVCDGSSYWDNNKGINYRIISCRDSTEHKKMVTQYQNLSGDCLWTDISCYDLGEKEGPYW